MFYIHDLKKMFANANPRTVPSSLMKSHGRFTIDLGGPSIAESGFAARCGRVAPGGTRICPTRP
jgi:hypothetical protein